MMVRVISINLVLLSFCLFAKAQNNCEFHISDVDTNYKVGDIWKYQVVDGDAVWMDSIKIIDQYFFDGGFKYVIEKKGDNRKLLWFENGVIYLGYQYKGKTILLDQSIVCFYDTIVSESVLSGVKVVYSGNVDSYTNSLGCVINALNEYKFYPASNLSRAYKRVLYKKGIGVVLEEVFELDGESIKRELIFNN